MAIVTWWLVTKNDEYSQRNLWVRAVEMTFLPHEGETVHIIATEEEPEGSVAGYPKSRYWNLDGTAHLQFMDYVIDPPEEFRPNALLTAWWTDRDGDLEAQLRWSGWVTYEEFEEQQESGSPGEVTFVLPAGLRPMSMTTGPLRKPAGTYTVDTDGNVTVHVL